MYLEVSSSNKRWWGNRNSSCNRNMLVRLLCVIFVVSSFLSCTRRDETAKIIKLELISSKIKNISLPNDIVNFDARASHYYFYTKDSVFIYDTQLNLVVKFGFKRLTRCAV